MIIVSQDKKDVVVFDNMKVLGVRENKIAITDNITNGSAFVIGKYQTEERAKEVLQGIIRKCQNPRNDMCYIVYEMPKE